METVTMRKSYEDVIIAAKAWQEVYESDGDYDGVPGCVARATLSLAVDAAVREERRREVAKLFRVPFRLVREAAPPQQQIIGGR
jgi:hypothetical protein